MRSEHSRQRDLYSGSGIQPNRHRCDQRQSDAELFRGLFSAGGELDWYRTISRLQVATRGRTGWGNLFLPVFLFLLVLCFAIRENLRGERCEQFEGGALASQ